MRRRGSLVMAGMGALALPCWAADEADITGQGRALLKANCARCHAIGANDESKHKSAPPFRTVVTRYPPDNLAEALAEGLSTGHPDMPEFVFEPDEVAAIVTYLASLQPETK